jgi:hypothetical protein
MGSNGMWEWIRIPKGMALLAFFLPWVTVSCSSQKIAEASGFGLATGNVPAINQIVGAASQNSINPWLILAMLAIVVGLHFAFTDDRKAAQNLLFTSTLALALIFVGMNRYTKDAIMAKAAESGTVDPASLAALAMVQIDWQAGYWLAIGSLIVSAGMASMMMAGKD